MCLTKDNLTKFENTTVVRKDSMCPTKDHFTSMFEDKIWTCVSTNDNMAISEIITVAERERRSE